MRGLYDGAVQCFLVVCAGMWTSPESIVSLFLKGKIKQQCKSIKEMMKKSKSWLEQSEELRKHYSSN